MNVWSPPPPNGYHMALVVDANGYGVNIKAHMCQCLQSFVKEDMMLN